jgi:hypothetical protein
LIFIELANTQLAINHSRHLSLIEKFSFEGREFDSILQKQTNKQSFENNCVLLKVFKMQIQSLLRREQFCEIPTLWAYNFGTV